MPSRHEISELIPTGSARPRARIIAGTIKDCTDRIGQESRSGSSRASRPRDLNALRNRRQGTALSRASAGSVRSACRMDEPREHDWPLTLADARHLQTVVPAPQAVHGTFFVDDVEALASIEPDGWAVILKDVQIQLPKGLLN